MSIDVIRAIQLIYPTISGGFAYWDTSKDGSTHINPIDGLVWNNAEFNKPTWTQIQNKLTEISIELLKSKLIDVRKTFLKESDFRVLRFVDEGTPYPNEIKDKRIVARQEINEIEATTTLNQLNQFSVIFN